MRREIHKKIDFIWSLEGLLNNGKTWFIPINRLPFRIGRSKDCQLSLASKSVSRYHAEIFKDDNSIFIHDLGSTNGTFLNKQSVKSMALLKNGDIIHIADLEFRVSSRRLTDLTQSKETHKTFDIEKGLQNNFVNCEEEFIEMISKKAVVPFFQPIVKLPDAHTIGYEILGRCFYKGLPSEPAELFKIAVMLGYEKQLSDIFRKEGFRVGKALPSKLALFFNTHPHEVFQKSFLKSLFEIRKIATGRPIVLEIHEKAITNVNLMKKIRAFLNDLNIGLAYDDFGAGQSRLIELIEAPPDILKFDIALVHNIHKAPLRKQQIIERLVKIVHDSGVIPLAEGIECGQESIVCSQVGFKCAQGFYFGKPGSIDSK